MRRPTSRPDSAAIRRALAECMTLADIDDAMGWSPGTARRRRWSDPERGGLPPSDAELAGVPLWFRATVEEWRAERRGRRPAGVPVTEPEQPEAEQPEPEQPEHEPEHEQPENEPERPEDVEPDGPEAEPVPERADEGPEEDEEEEEEEEEAEEIEEPPPEPEDVELDEEPEPVPITSGFDLEPGEQVLAHVHRAWRPAVVLGRDRRTVMVGYNIDGTPLGARQQRVSLDRVRRLSE